MKVFVYGTLKQGFRNHNLLINSKFLGTATTKYKYPMVNQEAQHPYPYSHPHLFDEENQGNYVKGEIFDVNDATLKELDILEGYPAHYGRKSIEVISDSLTMNAMAYFSNQQIDYKKSTLLEEFLETNALS